MNPNAQHLPANGTWFAISHIDQVKYDELGNLYELRNSMKYELRYMGCNSNPWWISF
jgi:hypothetical protein